MTPTLPLEDASFLNENVQKRSSTQGSGGRTKRFVMIMGTMMMILTIMMHQTFFSGTEKVEVIDKVESHATIIEQVTTEFGKNPERETISATITPSSYGQVNGSSTLSIIVKSARSNCTTGNCVFRMYASGPTRHGGYLHTHRDRLPESTENNATYSFQFPLYEPGTYKILVLLEALINNTETAGSLNSISIGYKGKGWLYFKRTYINVRCPRVLYDRSTRITKGSSDVSICITTLPIYCKRFWNESL